MGEVVNIRDFRRKEEFPVRHGMDRLIADSVCEIDTAPCEMPPPAYQAPERDPA